MRLLIVEDDLEFGENLKKILERKSFAIDVLEDGEEARKHILAHREEYDAIILDLVLPTMDGMTLTRTLRDHNITIPILILSARSEDVYKIELLNCGANDYIVKPVSTLELMARISNVLQRSPIQTRKRVHIIGDLTIDNTVHRVYVGNTEVVLTLKEYSLLECFANRPNEVLTRDELHDKVWDFNSDTLSNALDVHIKNLRGKLRHNNSLVHFETVRGVGYRLVE